MPAGYFNGRVGLVTGGSRGIGAAYVRRLAEAGAHVIAADILGEKAQEFAASLSGEGLSVRSLQMDVGDESAVAAGFAQIEAWYGHLDILVNNAAVMLDLEQPFKPFWETSWQEWTQVMQVNAGSVFLCCRAALPLLRRAEFGRVVNISSDAIYKGYDLQLAYFASKGAVSVMTRCLAREFGQFNINVNAIAPGFTLSEAVQGNDFMQKVARPTVLASCAIQREQLPSDLAGTLLFLCGPDSACITGQTLLVNCGAVMQ